MGFLEPDILKELEKMSNEMSLIRQALESLVELQQDKIAIDKSKDVDMGPDILYESLSDIAKSGQLADRVARALIRSNIRVMKDLTYCTLKDVKNVRNLGKKSLQNLIQFKESTNLDILRNTVPDKLPEVKIGDRIIYCGNEDRSDYTGAEIHKGDTLIVTDIHDRSSYVRFTLPTYVCRTSLTSVARIYLSPGQIATLK